MDGRTALVIFGSAAVAGAVRGLWAMYKSHQMRKPTPMRFRDGAYEPWGIEEKSQLWGKWFGNAATVYFGLLFLAFVALGVTGNL